MPSRASATIRNSDSAAKNTSVDKAEGPCLKKGGAVRSRVPRGMVGKNAAGRRTKGYRADAARGRSRRAARHHREQARRYRRKTRRSPRNAMKTVAGCRPTAPAAATFRQEDAQSGATAPPTSSAKHPPGKATTAPRGVRPSRARVSLAPAEPSPPGGWRITRSAAQ